MARKRKVRYHANMIDVAVKAANNGGTDQEIADAVGCHVSTFYRWMEKREAFRDAVTEAKRPPSQGADLDFLEELKAGAKAWMREYIDTKGAVVEQVTYKNGLQGDHVKVRKGGRPDFRLIDRILGTSTGGEEFQITISVAEPEIDDDEDDLSDEEEDI